MGVQAGPFPEKRTATWKAYIEAVGQVVHAWNSLQGTMGQLFLLTTEFEPLMGLAVWHSINSDRSQRGMLRAAVNVRYEGCDSDEKQKQKRDLRWMIDKADEVSDERNLVVHGLCTMGFGDHGLKIQPVTWFGNKKLNKLSGLDVIVEFTYCETCADSLNSFAREMETALRNPGRFPWPARPDLPTRSRRGRSLSGKVVNS